MKTTPPLNPKHNNVEEIRRMIWDVWVKNNPQITSTNGGHIFANALTTAIQSLINQARIEAYNIAILGKCPECKRQVKDWEAPSGSFAPELWATLREQDVDPSTGHKNNCEITKQLSGEQNGEDSG